MEKILIKQGIAEIIKGYSIYKKYANMNRKNLTKILKKI